jgi:hypothetical protein
VKFGYVLKLNLCTTFPRDKPFPVVSNLWLNSIVDKFGTDCYLLKVGVLLRIKLVTGDQSRVGVIHMFKNGRVVRLDDTIGHHLIPIPVAPPTKKFPLFHLHR